MADEDSARLSKRLLTALGLFETGVAMKRAQLRRAFPEASEEELRQRFVTWLHDRPGAEHGDASGDSFRVRAR